MYSLASIPRWSLCISVGLFAWLILEFVSLVGRACIFFLMSGKYNRLCMTLVFLLGWGDEVMFFLNFFIE